MRIETEGTTIELFVVGQELRVACEDSLDIADNFSVYVPIDRNTRDLLVDALMRIPYHVYVIYTNIHADGKNMWSTMHREDGSGEAIFASEDAARDYMHERAERAFGEYESNTKDQLTAIDGNTRYEWYVVKRESA